MPSTNPLISIEDAQGSTPFAAPVVTQGVIPTSSYGSNHRMMPQAVSPASVNAAGTSENVAMHIAIIAALALIGVYVLRASGFKFVLAGSFGVGR